MNPKLIKEITERVEQAKKEKADESILAAHLDAIAEVYEIDRSTVESISRQVIQEKSASKTPINFIRKRPIVGAAVVLVMVMAVIWMLYTNTQVFKGSDSGGLSKQNMRTIGYVGEALSSLNVAKISVDEHFQATGSMPSSFAEIGVNESDLVQTKYIDRLQMTGDGTIVVDLSRLIGNQRYIKLKPTVRIASYQIEWDCRSNLERVVLDEIEGCTPDI